jgi:hypothetical protein
MLVRTFNNCAPEATPFFRGQRRSLLKKSLLSRGLQIFKKVSMEPKSYTVKGQGEIVRADKQVLDNPFYFWGIDLENRSQHPCPRYFLSQTHNWCT